MNAEEKEKKSRKKNGTKVYEIHFQNHEDKERGAGERLGKMYGNIKGEHVKTNCFLMS